MASESYENLTDNQLKIMDEYARDEMLKLKKICHDVWGNKGIPMSEHDDLYSDALKVLDESVLSFDGTKGISFEKYLKTNIGRSYKDWYRDNYFRSKRNNLVLDEKGKIKRDENGNPFFVKNISFDEESEEGMDLSEKIASDFDVEGKVDFGFDKDEKVGLFLNNLPDMPRKISKMIMEGMSSKEIRNKLNMSVDEYRDYWKIITTYENKRILYKESNFSEDNTMNKINISTEDVAESYKNTSYSIDSISKQLRKNRIRDDHILQRSSGLWKGFAKSELVSDVLRGKSLTQIIISEEIKNGLRMQWLIDGKQRCTTLDDFLHDGFSISKNVKNYNIRYQTTKTDEDGCEVLNEDGFTEIEFKEFDIRGKKFSQLPEELQEIFKDRQIPVLYNMNCTKKDIAEDIARFNRSRPMNVAENGWLGLDESFAELVENISKMQFFQKDFKGSSYSQAAHTSGKIKRTIVEAIMVSDFIEEFNDFDKMCEFLTEEASDSNFTDFYCLIERLTLISNEEVAKMFNLTDSFLWLGLFSKFSTLGIEDKRFIDFMIEFERSMKDRKVKVTYDGADTNSFNDLCINPITKRSRATKDKNMVIAKIELLEKLMNEYLHIEEKDLEEVDALDFIRENVDPTANNEDVELYTMMLDDCVKVDSPVYKHENMPSLLAMIAYGMKENKDTIVCKWLTGYADKTTNFAVSQRQNYLNMMNCFKKEAIAMT